MKKISKRKLLSGFIYVAFVGGLLGSTMCESHVELTTPERDAQKLAFMAETVHSENELRNLEKLANEYVIAYGKSYNGAKAMYFKSLAEPILIAAGDRREEIRAEEDYLAAQQKAFNGTLQDMDQAWRTKLGTDEEIAAKIASNNQQKAKTEAEIAALDAEKKMLGEAAWAGEAGQLDKKCLEKIGKVEQRIKSLEKKIVSLEHDNHILLLAYRLQRGSEFVAPCTEVEDATETMDETLE
jgi:hypothetical protein